MPDDTAAVRDVPIFRAEMMDAKNLWMSCMFGETEVRFWVRARKGRLEFTCTDAPSGDGYEHESAP